MVLQSNRTRGFGFLAALIILMICMGLSLVLGYTDVTFQDAWRAFTTEEQSNTLIVIRSLRLPRVLIAASVGASLALAGALLQALTRNPLASPQIFGVNAGASFFVVMAIAVFQSLPLGMMAWVSFIGAAVAATIVYAIGSIGKEGLTPVRLTLAGAAIAALFSSLTQGILVLNEKALDEVLFWLAGSVQGRSLEYLQQLLPYLLVGWVGTFFIGKHLNILTMGEDLAKGLGQKTAYIKLSAGILTVLLSGGAVAIAGPIGFIGIVVPHFARYIVGYDHRWILPYSAILGGILLLLADISARFIIMPEEVPVGVMTAIIGTPFFIYIARKGLKST
ncbi:MULTISPECIES: FecCD family ABC transporter permease [Pontibacillus]|uniref:Iron ABC transporter permease n=1 Tax=Pontibacillus chungwhensis TaxID=265426 RepID=A0ABY8UY59_9BACI|nr:MULTISPECIES: iron ABC transporter permease [Pontibacillus]MCD5325061.1 iron ABC transporter permease [Pontibacillus sp. HN14]WIF97314.1 iron ABC transporter permease [Pontibacillus chungwhensis]